MNHICVNIKPTTDLGRIHYFHDPEIYKNILFITSSVPRYNIWSINIQGGLAVIDFDKNRLLKSLECLYPRYAWLKTQSLSIPTPEFYGDIEFVEIQSDKGDIIKPYSSKRMGKQFLAYVDDSKVEILTDNSYSIAWVMIGNHDRSGTWVGLSDRCSALIRGNELSGFFVNLENAPLRSFPRKPILY